MLPVIETFTEDMKQVNTLLQLATATRNILQKLTIKDIQVVTLPDNYFKFKFVTEDGTTIETNSVFIGESISIDTALSLVSTNPVQNKVITAAINAINGVSLWENGNPTSSFGTQMITTADMSHFKYLVIEYSRDKNGSYANTYSKNKFKVSSTISLFYITTYQANTYIAARDVAIVNNTTINFGNGTINGETNNDQIIPLAIYGIK